MQDKKILLTSIWKPIGPCVGDAESVGYELLHGQVTRAQHIYSPRVLHKQFSLDYIAENLDAPSTVLHYPSHRQFTREIKKGYDYVGISFVLSTAHHMRNMCRLIRKHAPSTRIILGGYGTVMSKDELAPFCDVVCKGEGVAFLREYLGEPPLDTTRYKHPDIRSRLRLFGIPVAQTAMIFAGLGCPNGCDFCCTSHYFKKRHIRLLENGDSVFDLMKRHKQRNPNIGYTIIDEDFLLNTHRSGAFLKRCRDERVSFSTFCFASVKAITRYTVEEILEMGIDGLWIGYEGKKSGYSKHEGANIDELIKELQDHGITVLTSMIVGIPYQSEEIARREFADLMETRPALSQFLIYGPTPGTPFFDKVMDADLLRQDLKVDRMKYYRECTGFTSMVKHPILNRHEIESLQREFYDQDFDTLGPSVLRVARIKLNGWKKLNDHPNPLLKKKSLDFKKNLAVFLTVLPVGVLGPKISFQNRIMYLRQILEILKVVPFIEKCYLLAFPIMLVSAMIKWFNMSVLRWSGHPLTRVYFYQGRMAQGLPKKRMTGFWRILQIAWNVMRAKRSVG